MEHVSILERVNDLNYLKICEAGSYYHGDCVDLSCGVSRCVFWCVPTLRVNVLPLSSWWKHSLNGRQPFLPFRFSYPSKYMASHRIRQRYSENNADQ